jgi:CHAT domain-containing protein/tetratricopeptide (TPR) repeat protein
VDVVAIVSDPDGSEIVQVDLQTEPTPREGSESVPFVADRAGTYRLVVRDADDKTSGTYAVRLDRPRPATAEDRARADAVRLWSATKRSDARRSTESVRKALDAYERSSQLFVAIGDREDAARVLFAAADLASATGDTARSVEIYGRVLTLAASAGARRLEGKAHAGIGVGLRKLGSAQEAREHQERALEIFQALGDQRGVGAALANLGAVEWDEFGDASEALRRFEQALDISHATGDVRLERAALHNMASIHDWSGEKTEAVELYQRALALERASGDRLSTVLTLNEMGLLYTQWGDYPRAMDLHTEALGLVRQIGNRPQEVWTLLHIGRTFALLEKSDQAVPNLERALALSRAIGDRALEAHALGRLGETYDSRGETAAALEHLRAAVVLYRGLTERREPYWLALTSIHLARTCLRAGEIDAAEAALTEARQVAGRYAAAGIDAAALRELARVALARGDLETALDRAGRAVDAVESERAKITQGDVRTTYFASVHPYYQTHVDALIALDAAQPGAGYARQALHVSERARARRVLEGLAESTIDIRSSADPALVERERTLRRQLSIAAMQEARLDEKMVGAGRRAPVEKRLRDLAAERQDVITALRRGSPAYADLVQPPILDAVGIQQQLDPGTTLLEYALGDDQSCLWVVTRDAVAVHRLPGAAAIDAAARRLYDALSARAADAPGTEAAAQGGANADRAARRAATEASRLLLPDGVVAPGVTRIVIVADGAVQIVPFAALPLQMPAGKPAAPLGSRVRIVYAPSASWVAALRRFRANTPAPPRAVALMADPVFDAGDSRVEGPRRESSPPAPVTRAALESGLRASGDRLELPRLPFTGREALRIARIVPAPDHALLALGFDASRDRAVSAELTQYRIVHFATHSLLDNEHPDLSGIVLSLVDRRGRASDGFLRVQDIYGMRLTADLVVLSACQTAIGKSIPGEGLMGVARAFMYAGARRVVASLWPVDERATAELMTAFYTELLQHHRPADEALRRAQRAIAASPRWHAPYYWAGFILEGDWQ